MRESPQSVSLTRMRALNRLGWVAAERVWVGAGCRDEDEDEDEETLRTRRRGARKGGETGGRGLRGEPPRLGASVAIVASLWWPYRGSQGIGPNQWSAWT